MPATLEYKDKRRRLHTDTDPGLAARMLIALIGAYQQSAWRRWLHRDGPRCRFIPSCSEYSIRALRKYGVAKGLRSTMGRLWRCAPSTVGSYVDFP